MSGETATAAQGQRAGVSAAASVGHELAPRSNAETARSDAAHASQDANQSQRVGVYAAPTVGPHDLASLPGPFTARQLARIDEALTLATQETGLLFSLYVGALAEPTRAAAEAMVARIPAPDAVGVVLLAVSPGQRVLHIVTARGAAKRLTNRVCALAALGMRAAFSGGDLTAGVVNGLRMLADSAGGE